jgi:polar amino acid transport system permease protein
MNRGGASPSRRHLLPVASLSRLPYWLLVVMLLGVLAVWSVVREEDYRVIFRAVSRGIGTTLYVSVISYAAAAAIGLLFGLMRASHRRVLREAASVYIEVVRGVPMLVILYYVAFVAAPALVVLINRLAEPLIAAGWLQPLSVRRIDFVWRAIIALTVGYSAFLAEIFRAGIEAVPRGQLEAALSLGMSRRQAMLRVVLPQAARTVLPPLGNDFVAMIKDSALVSVLGVQDITQQAKVYSASSFRFFETYNTVAFLYLVLTISLSLLVRGLERRLRRHVDRER